MEGMTWEQFLQEINTIFEISQKLQDNWRLVNANDDPGGIYLAKTASIPIGIDDADAVSNDELSNTDFEEETNLRYDENSTQNERLYRFEYHVLYHVSYAVPYLCFNAYNSNGSLLTVDGAWKIFIKLNGHILNGFKLDMKSVLTQMEHPILFKPFLTLHPCRIAEVLHSLPNSKNKVLSFLSAYGTAVYLSFDLNYGKLLENSTLAVIK